MYATPVMNLLVDEWVPPNTPAIGAPDNVALACQIYIPSRMEGIEQYEAGGGTYTPPIIFRHLGTLDESRGVIHNDGPGSTVYYKSVFSQKMHLGFPNEYDAEMHIQCNADGTSPRTY